MFRRMLVSVVAVALSGVFLSACSPAPTTPNVVVSEQPMAVPESAPTNPAPAPEGEPEPLPPVVEKPIVVVSSPVDPNGFGQAPIVDGWVVYNSQSYAVVTIQLSSYDDWSYFARMVGLGETVDPSQVQLDEETARSLIDLDQLADEIMQRPEGIDADPVDIRTIELHFDLIVSGM